MKWVCGKKGKQIGSGKWSYEKSTIKWEGINRRVDDGYESHAISSHLHDCSSLCIATHHISLCYDSQSLSLASMGNNSDLYHTQVCWDFLIHWGRCRVRLCREWRWDAFARKLGEEVNRNGPYRGIMNMDEDFFHLHSQFRRVTSTLHN